MKEETGLSEEPRGRIIVRGMLVGAAAGLLYGVLTDNIAIGVTMGPGAGVGIAALIRAFRERKRKG